MLNVNYLALAAVYAVTAVLMMQDGQAAHAFLAMAAAAIHAAQGGHPPAH